MWPDAASVVYYVGIGVHAFMAALLGQRFGLRPAVPVAISACYLLGMTVGAKALADVGEGRFKPATLLRREHLVAGGFWGGPAVYLVLAVPVVLVMTKRRPASSLKPEAPSRKPQSSRPNPQTGIPEPHWRAGLDLVALAAPIPMIVAKVACLCAGCCHGKTTGLPWAITFPPGGRCAPGGVALHPTQVYDMLALVVVAGVLVWVNHQPRWRGTLLLWFVGLYGLGRLVTEFTRAEMPGRMHWGPLTAFQWLCAASAAACAVGIVMYGRSRKRARFD